MSFPPQGQGATLGDIAADIAVHAGLPAPHTNLRKGVAAQEPFTYEQMIAVANYAWTGETGENKCWGLVQDADYIYACLYIDPGKVIKIAKSTMTTVAIWTGETGENKGYSLTQETDYVYVGLDTIPAKVIKIAKATMTTSATWTGAGGEDYCAGITSDDDFLYAGLEISPAKVIKIAKATMTTSATWTGAGGEDYCTALVQDTDYVYFGGYTSPIKIIKIAKATMTTSASFTGDAGDDICYALTLDDVYVYAGVYQEPGKVIKIGKAAMNGQPSWTGGTDDKKVDELAQDDDYIYASLDTQPGRVVKIIKITMLAVDCFIAGPTEWGGTGLTLDGSFVYVGYPTSPTSINKIDNRRLLPRFYSNIGGSWWPYAESRTKVHGNDIAASLKDPTVGVAGLRTLGTGAQQAAVGATLAAHGVDFGLHKKVIRKTADQIVNNSETLVNDTHLLFAIAANEIWFVRFIFYGISTLAADWDFQITTPSGSDGEVGAYRRGEVMTPFALNAEIRVPAGQTNEIEAEFIAIIKNGATPGNVQVQWAQGNAEVSDTKLLANSCMIATQLV